jgi:hypothetical protein
MRSTRTWRVPWAGGAAAAVLVAGTLFVPAPTAEAQATLIQVSQDPYTNPTSQHATQVEPDSFSFGNTIVVATQSGRFFDGGASNTVFARSGDGGQTWTSGGLPNLTTTGGGGTFARTSDPVVAYAAESDTWLIGSLGIDAAADPEAVVVSRSTNGGVSWGNPVTVGTGTFPDKNWTACDNWTSSPFYGNCYTEWDENATGNTIKMSTSTNGGATWGPTLNTVGNATGLGGIPVPQPNGNVVVPIGSANLGAIRAIRSTNGGASWSSGVTITNTQVHDVAGNIRHGPIPSSDVDAAGRVYTAWHDCRFRTGCTSNDIVMTTSLDGLTWNSVVRIPIDAVTSGRDHFIPGLAVDPTTSGATAHLALTYYYYPVASCTGDGCELRAGFVESFNGGATWTAPQDLAGLSRPSWIADTSQGRMVGDYISTSFVDGQAWPVFSFATSAPSGGVFNQDTFTAAIGEPPPPPTTVFSSDFEAATPTWTANPLGTDTATTGQWARGDPAQTTSGGTVLQLGTTTSGANDLATGLAAGASVGANDVDGGVTTIQSPAIALPATGTLTLQAQWYLAHLNNATSADFFRIFVVQQNGTATQVFQQLGSATTRAGAWAQASVSLNAFAGQTVSIRVQAADAATGSLIEAGVDDVRITQQT